MQTNTAGQVVIKPKTAWRDGTAYLMMLPPGFMQQQIDGLLCGIEFCEGFVSSESAGASRVLHLDAGNLVHKLRYRIADVLDRQRTTLKRHLKS